MIPMATAKNTPSARPKVKTTATGGRQSRQEADPVEMPLYAASALLEYIARNHTGSRIYRHAATDIIVRRVDQGFEVTWINGQRKRLRSEQKLQEARDLNERKLRQAAQLKGMRQGLHQHQPHYQDLTREIERIEEDCKTREQNIEAAELPDVQTETVFVHRERMDRVSFA